MSEHRFAIHLSFTAPGTLAEFNLVPGSTYDGKLCYYKGVGSLRALFKECELSEEAITLHFYANLQEATARYREALQQNPFAENVPVLVENLRLAVQGKQLCVQDATTN